MSAHYARRTARRHSSLVVCSDPRSPSRLLEPPCHPEGPVRVKCTAHNRHPHSVSTAEYGGPRKRNCRTYAGGTLLATHTFTNLSALPQAVALRIPVKLNVSIFRPSGFTDGSHKLGAIRSKTVTASFRTLFYLARPPPLLI
jgi:hypothetical protein